MSTEYSDSVSDSAEFFRNWTESEFLIIFSKYPKFEQKRFTNYLVIDFDLWLKFCPLLFFNVCLCPLIFCEKFLLSFGFVFGLVLCDFPEFGLGGVQNQWFGWPLLITREMSDIFQMNRWLMNMLLHAFMCNFKAKCQDPRFPTPLIYLV